MKKIKLLTIISYCIFSWNIFGQISGTVYRDFIENEMKDNSATFNENGLGGDTVNANNAAGKLVGGITSATDGSYSLIGLNLPVRFGFIPVLVQDFDGSNEGQSSTNFKIYRTTNPFTNFRLKFHKGKLIVGRNWVFCYPNNYLDFTVNLILKNC